MSYAGYQTARVAARTGQTIVLREESAEKQEELWPEWQRRLGFY